MNSNIAVPSVLEAPPQVPLHNLLTYANVLRLNLKRAEQPGQSLSTQPSIVVPRGPRLVFGSIELTKDLRCWQLTIGVSREEVATVLEQLKAKICWLLRRLRA